MTPILIPYSSDGISAFAGQSLSTLICAFLFSLLIFQYVGWFFLLSVGEFKSKKAALLRLIPFSIIFVFILFIFDKLRDLE